MIRAASGPPSRLGLRVGATPGPAALAGTQAGIDPDDRDSGSAPGARGAGCGGGHASVPGPGVPQ
jgi:hypothetical protein